MTCTRCGRAIEREDLELDTRGRAWHRACAHKTLAEKRLGDGVRVGATFYGAYTTLEEARDATSAAASILGTIIETTDEATAFVELLTTDVAQRKAP